MGNSSWSVASSSASSLMVSTAGPRSRSASTRTPSCPPGIAWICSVRDSESGLYCSAMTLFTTEVSGSIVTMPPLTRRGRDAGRQLPLFLTPDSTRNHPIEIRRSALVGVDGRQARLMASIPFRSRAPCRRRTCGAPAGPRLQRHPPELAAPEFAAKLDLMQCRWPGRPRTRDSSLRQSVHQGLPVGGIDAAQHQAVDVHLDDAAHTHPRISVSESGRSILTASNRVACSTCAISTGCTGSAPRGTPRSARCCGYCRRSC